MAEIKSFVETEIQQNKVMVFSKTYCPYCTKAKKALGSAGAVYKVVELDNLRNGGEIQAFLVSMTGSRTVPQVFVNGNFIGGGTETENLYRSGELQKMLK